MTESENRFEKIAFIEPDLLNWNPGNAVHVWKFPVLPADFSLLTNSEKIIAERFRFDGDRNRYVMGRRSLRFLLARYLLLDPLDIQIIAEKGQKPYLQNPGSTIRFNICLLYT